METGAAVGTALLYDEEMTNYKLLWVDPACKIEVPERLTVTHEALLRTGLVNRCVSIPVREAVDAEILLIHSEEYLEAVKKTPYMTLEDLKDFTLQYGDVYFHPNIYHCAKLAAGTALELVDAVLTGKVRNGMALVRPPGHHSMRDAANGFCVFNNVAIAAKYAQQKHGMKRVLIVDWDVHHGQGVQYSFEDDPSVLYFSWHRYEHQKFWPNLKQSDFDSVGTGEGAGRNINVPWNKVGMKNSDYLSVFFHVLLPAAYEFAPELVLVCAGFDSAIGDPEGEMCATPDIFAHLTHLLMNLAGGRVCAVLEGGYNLTSLPQSVCQTVHTLLGDPCPRPQSLAGPCRSALETLHCVRAAHQKLWSCFSHAADAPTSEISTKRVKLAAGEPEQPVGGASTETVWPEPPQHASCPVRVATVLPDHVTVPGCCQRFCSPPIRQESSVAEDQSTLGRVLALVDAMDSNKICSGLALVSDVSMATTRAVQHAAAQPSRRVLVVLVGDTELGSLAAGAGKTLQVRLSPKQPEEQNKWDVSVCLKKVEFSQLLCSSGCSDASALAQAMLGLLLPLGYQFDPSLVLLSRSPGCGVSDDMWQQLTGLLRGLALGHILVLMQESEESSVAATVASLSGDPAPPLGRLAAPQQEDLDTLESLRRRLQADWTMLMTTAAPDTDQGGD
ncbi:polyamine deacetylase HDAC10 [Neosynchiropus ocellatus]